MEINLQECSQMERSEQAVVQLVFGPITDGLDLQLISSPAVDQPLQNLTVLETQLNQLISPEYQQETLQNTRVSSLGLSCKCSIMTATSTPVTLQAFLLELQNEGVVSRRSVAAPQISLKINRCKKKCAICQEIVKEKQTIHNLKCKHIYHRHCLLRWKQRNSRCPLCRKCLW